ncbi:MAG TPA: hypothetical protein VGM13_08680 [Thermoanaerobaculia bacterium]|jgi:hypothetical protein
MRHGKPPSGPGRPFGKGNPGRPKGKRDLATTLRAEISQALIAKAFGRVAELAVSRSQRVSLEACKVILAYGLGLPRQTVEIQGGNAELARELATAIREARSRRGMAEAPSVPAVPAAGDGAAMLAALPPPPVLDAELVPSAVDCAGQPSAAEEPNA